MGVCLIPTETEKNSKCSQLVFVDKKYIYQEKGWLFLGFWSFMVDCFCRDLIDWFFVVEVTFVYIGSLVWAVNIYFLEEQDDWEIRCHWEHRPTQPQGQESGSSILMKDGEEVFFKIKSSTTLKKLMDAYCQRQSVDLFSYSWALPMSDSSSMARDCMRPRPPRTWTWRTETRSMWWLSKLEARHSDSIPKTPSYSLTIKP